MRFTTALALAVAGALLLAACGSSRAPATRLAAWSVTAPYLPPPTPAAPAQLGAARTAPPVTHRAAAPSAAATAASGTDDAVAPGAPSNAEIARELAQAYHGAKDAKIEDVATLQSGGLASVPVSAPQKVAEMIEAGNQVATRPYVYGGGHGGGPEGLFIDTAYDCSGSVSFALADAGYLKSPEASGELEHFGKSGPGKWVTIYASATHAWMVVAGLRFDTVGLQQTGSRWQTGSRSTVGFFERHPAGL